MMNISIKSQTHTAGSGFWFLLQTINMSRELKTDRADRRLLKEHFYIYRSKLCTVSKTSNTVLKTSTST